MDNKIDWKKYLIVLLITMGLFFTAAYITNYFGNKKVDQLRSIQDKISIDILSSETQFSLLSELSCKNISDAVFSGELGELGTKLEWSEKNLGAAEEVSYLKKYYSLLEIKDYLLSKKIAARCGVKSAFILYFYTTAQSCRDCEEQGYVLSTLRAEFPELRVYSFDYSIDLSAVSSMLGIYKIKGTALPALVIDDNVLTGFRNLKDLEKIIQDSFKLQEKAAPVNANTKASSSATN